MNLAISLGLILSAVVVTARIVKPGVSECEHKTPAFPNYSIEFNQLSPNVQGETNNYVDKAAAIPEEGDEEIVQTAVGKSGKFFCHAFVKNARN